MAGGRFGRGGAEGLRAMIVPEFGEMPWSPPTDHAIVAAARILDLAIRRFYGRHPYPMAFHLRSHVVERVRWLVWEYRRLAMKGRACGEPFGFELAEVAGDGCMLKVVFRMRAGSSEIETRLTEVMSSP